MFSTAQRSLTRCSKVPLARTMHPTQNSAGCIMVKDYQNKPGYIQWNHAHNSYWIKENVKIGETATTFCGTMYGISPPPSPKVLHKVRLSTIIPAGSGTCSHLRDDVLTTAIILLARCGQHMHFVLCKVCTSSSSFSVNPRCTCTSDHPACPYNGLYT